MEVRQLLQLRITFHGEVSKIIDSLNDTCKKYSRFNRLCIEWNPGHGQGWMELVGYRDETKEEIEAHNRSEERKKKSAIKHILKKEAELKKLRKDFKRKHGE